MMFPTFAGYLAQVLYFPVQLAIAVMVFSWRLRRRDRFGLRLLGWFGLLLGVLLALYLFAGWAQWGIVVSDGVPATMSSVFWCGLLFLFSAALVYLCFAVALREAVYCASCAYLMEHMVYCCRLLIAALPGGYVVKVGGVVYVAMYVVLYGAVYLGFVRRMVQEGHYVTSAVGSLRLTLSVLTVVLVMSVLATQYGFEPVHAIYALFCCIYALYGQLKQQRQLALQSQLSLQKQLWVQQKSQYELSRESIEIINRKCHDLKHQVAALKHIYDQEEQSKVIDSLQESVMIYDSILKTGNEILDTVLTEKSLLCNQKQIVLSCIADGAQLSFLEPVDLYTLFGNALDNAMEAVQKLPAGERYIDVQVRRRAGLVLVQVANPYAGELVMDGDLPRTDKAQEPGYHGFGVRSIREVAERNGGIFSLESKDARFVVRIAFPARD